MSSESFKCVGPGEVLAYLRADLRRATKSLFIIGPWLDDYFAEQVVKPASRDLDARVLVRSETEVDALAAERTRAALAIFAAHWATFESRHLTRLHAKCVCIDGRTVYVGSANWYRYSMENAVEIVVRGPVEAIEGGASQLESLWDRGEVLAVAPRLEKADEAEPPAVGINHEVLDPLAAEALKANPKAFVLGKKGRRREPPATRGETV
jgi:hypothetical protein